MEPDGRLSKIASNFSVVFGWLGRLKGLEIDLLGSQNEVPAPHKIYLKAHSAPKQQTLKSDNYTPCLEHVSHLRKNNFFGPGPLQRL